MWSWAGFMSQAGFASAVLGQGWGVLTAQTEPSIMWLPLCSGSDSRSIPGHPAVPWVFQLGNQSVTTPEHLEISFSGYLWSLYGRVLS